jgi:hypothetical protein
MKNFTPKQLESLQKLIGLANRYRVLSNELDSAHERSTYESELFEAVWCDLDDTRFEIMEIVLAL